nr:anti-SIV gp148 Ig heavy chain {CDR3 heavy chain region} [Macaca fascicularis=cynomolgus monkey, Peptide Partial, 19 aa] [Macaca fascicularis]
YYCARLGFFRFDVWGPGVL